MQTDGLPLAKPRPRALEKRDRRAAIKARDERESRKVRKRSGGRCEVQGQTDPGWFMIHPACARKAVEIHHLKGGIGRRGIRDSALAAWKLHVCKPCHRDITNHVLVPLDPQADALHVVYRRVR